jgi:hypothetical protein
MSTTETRIPLAQARALAEEVAALLATACTELVIAGSIRRQAETIGDLEIVASPLLERETVASSFWDPALLINRLDDRVDVLLANGVFVKRLDKNGRQAVGQLPLFGAES